MNLNLPNNVDSKSHSLIIKEKTEADGLRAAASILEANPTFRFSYFNQNYVYNKDTQNNDTAGYTLTIVKKSEVNVDECD